MRDHQRENTTNNQPAFGLLIPKMQELKPEDLHFALLHLKDKIKAVEDIGSGIYSTVDVMERIFIDYDPYEGTPLDTYILGGLLTSIKMHTEHIGALLSDVTESLNIHDVDEGHQENWESQ